MDAADADADAIRYKRTKEIQSKMLVFSALRII